MDELEISGKRYLSTRFAGKLHHYHSDYIGQLIRGNKVVGKKVGRSWYVQAESLENYLNKEKVATENRPIVIEEPVPIISSPVLEQLPPVIGHKIVEPPPEESAEEVPVPITRAYESVEYEKEEPVPIRKSGGLIYRNDDSPFLPELNKQIFPVRIRKEKEAEETVHTETIQEQPRIAMPAVTSTRTKNKIVTPLLTLGGIAAVCLVLAMALSSLVLSTTQVQEGQPASAGYSIR